MPDKWEYPWYAAWDLAFQCIAMATVDPEFAKHQLLLIMREWYMKPDGQLPAYEWNFSDVNPPVHAWAAFEVYTIEKEKKGKTAKTAAVPAPEKNAVQVNVKIVTAAEKEVARLTLEKEKLEAKMADPAFYSDSGKSAEAQKLYKKILADLETQETIWLEAQTA